MYTIKRAAAATGIPEATLRAWERRYAVVAPQRTPAGYRLYDEHTLADLRTMQALVRSGWAPSQAATEVARRRTGTDLAALGAASLGAFARPADSIASLVEAAGRMDAITIGQLLDAAFARASIEGVVRDWLLPALAALGEAWAAGEVSVAGEHLTSHAVLRRLSAAYEAAGESIGGPRFVIGLARDAQHELGALSFAVICRRLGSDLVYLGAQVPESQWVEAVAKHEADAAVVVAPTPPDAAAAQRALDLLDAHCPGVAAYVGGGAQDQVGRADQRLGHDVVAAAQLLVTTR